MVCVFNLLHLPSSLLHRQQGGVPAAARRSTLGAGAAGPHRLSVAADNAGMGGSPWAVNRHSLATRGRRSSVAPSRLSGTGKMLSRLSVGLTDALQWLGIRGKIPAAGAAAAQGLHAADAGAGAAGADRPALSPIASPGGEEGGSEAGDSPLLSQSRAVTALEQLPADSSAAAASPAAAAAADDEEADAAAVDEEAAAAAASPLPAADEQPAEAEPAEEETAANEQAAEAAAEAEAAPASPAIEALRHELEAKLQLQEQQAAQLEEAAAEAEGPAEDEEAEELTSLQQLLVLCGQEVRRAVWDAAAQCVA